MPDLFDQFISATSLTGELEFVVDAEKIPIFDTAIHSRVSLASELGPLVGRALRIQAEFTNSMPQLIETRKRHIAMVEASRMRGLSEHEVAVQSTLRPSPRGAALFQVADNELAASLQLRDAAHSIVVELGEAFGTMNSRLDTFDTEAALIATEEDLLPSWHNLARGAIDWYLSDKAK